MSGKFNAYQTFRAWYGVPEDWKELRIRDVVDIVGGGTPDTDQPGFWGGDIPWLTPTEMTSLRERVATTSERKLTQAAIENSNCRLLPVGSLVLSTRGTIGLVAVAGVPLTCNQSCEALLPKDENDGNYLYYLLRFIRPILERFGAGTTFTSITRRDFRDIRVGIASPPEQTVISKILIAADEVLKASEQKLFRAQALKQGLLQTLFTKGIPGRYVSFQETNWTCAPSCWKPRQLRDVADVEAGFTMGRDLSGCDVIEVPYLTVINVQDGAFDLTDVQKVQVKKSELDGILLRDRDVLMTEGGDRDKLGRGALWREQIAPCVYQNHIFRIRFRSDTYRPELFHFLIQTWHAKRYFYAHAKQTSNLCTINSRELKRFPFFEPDKDEQQKMIDMLQCADAAIQAAEQERKSLDRFRTALLRNLLTGNVRVKV